jgi:hypothetical protein
VAADQADQVNQAAQAAHAAFDKGRLAVVGQHVLDPQNLSVIAPDRHHVQNEGAADGEGPVAGPVRLEMRGQALEIGRRRFTQG